MLLSETCDKGEAVDISQGVDNWYVTIISKPVPLTNIRVPSGLKFTLAGAVKFPELGDGRGLYSLVVDAVDIFQADVNVNWITESLVEPQI